MKEPVVVPRRRPEYGVDRRVIDENPRSLRAYVGGNNHHIEIREAESSTGSRVLKGEVITTFEATQRNRNRLQAMRDAGIPDRASLALLPKPQRRAARELAAAIDREHPVVDRRNDDARGGRFIMSLAEGEMLWMVDKASGKEGFFVVVKLDRPQTVVVVPHWDARSETGRKGDDAAIIPGSSRSKLSLTPSDLLTLAPAGHPHARKVRVAPVLGTTILEGD